MVVIHCRTSLSSVVDCDSSVRPSIRSPISVLTPQVVVLDAARDGGRADRPVDHTGHVHPQFDRVGKCRLQAALDGRPDFVGEAVRELERHQNLVVLDQRDNAQRLRRLGVMQWHWPERTSAQRPTNPRDVQKRAASRSRATNVAHRRDPVVTLLVPDAMIQQGFSPSTQCETWPPHRCADRCRCFRTAELCPEPRPITIFHARSSRFAPRPTFLPYQRRSSRTGRIVWPRGLGRQDRRRQCRGQNRHALRHRRAGANARLDAAAAEMRGSELPRHQRQSRPMDPGVSGARDHGRRASESYRAGQDIPLRAVAHVAH